MNVFGPISNRRRFLQKMGLFETNSIIFESEWQHMKEYIKNSCLPYMEYTDDIY